MRRRLLFLILAIVAGGLALAPRGGGPSAESLIAAARKYDARILRDTWGVPHVFGKTDSDAAYGLGYAHAEDDFKTIEEGLLLVRGKLASLQGKEAAPGDYMVQLLRVWDLIDAQYQSDLSPEVRAICEAYADGVNHYAALHPAQVHRGVLPFTGKDIVAGFVFKGPFFYGLDNQVKRLFDTKAERKVSKKVADVGDFIRRGTPLGSNAFAVGPGRTPDGKTLLNINSHQPWEGPVAWYEAHVHSEEGWDMVGGTFPGAPLILLGHNRYLGWAHTVNSPDLADTYVLEMNPENPNQYKFDGEWRDLEVRQAPIKVKLWGPFWWTVYREALWSVYGPAVRQEKGVCALRYAGREDIRQVEQWWNMNKARNFEEWRSAMQMRAIPSLNALYADCKGTVYYLYNARFPIRAEGYDWRQSLPGNTSETLWKEYLPFDKLPQVLNPPSGFVISCNNTPFNTTTGEGNPKPEDFSKTLGIETHMTNRSLRALELFGADKSITSETFYSYKYDVAYSKESDVAKAVRDLSEAPPSEDPIIQEGTEIIRKWDLRTNPENTAAAIALIAIQPDPDGGHRGGDVSHMRENIRKYGPVLKEKHGRMDVPWGEVNRLIRGNVDVPVGGGPDVLRGLYSLFERNGALYGFEDGTVEGKGGDSYILLASWDKEGKVSSQSIHQFGSATQDVNSPHYSDQAPVFARQEMKPVWMDEEEIRKHLEREYRPGE
jgi:penicillin amidase/acyl-homoserine-lactone acylase